MYIYSSFLERNVSTSIKFKGNIINVFQFKYTPKNLVGIVTYTIIEDNRYLNKVHDL